MEKKSAHSSWHARYGRWALITGAAQGLGAAYARLLAQRGMHLVLVDVQEQVRQVAMELEEICGVETRPLLVDLADRGAPAALMAPLEALDCRLLVYCAAYGPVKDFWENDAAELDRYVDVNARALLQLSHAFSRRLQQREATGGLIIISSLAGLWGTSLVAPYGATKAFDWNLAEALHYELKPSGIDVLAVCAGAMRTPNYLATRPQYGRLRPRVDDPADIAGRTLRQLGRRAFYVPGGANRLLHFLFSRLLPRAWAAGLMNRTMRRMYGRTSTFRQTGKNEGSGE